MLVAAPEPEVLLLQERVERLGGEHLAVGLGPDEDAVLVDDQLLRPPPDLAHEAVDGRARLLRVEPVVLRADAQVARHAQQHAQEVHGEAAVALGLAEVELELPARLRVVHVVVEAAAPLGLRDLARLAKPAYVVAQRPLAAGQGVPLGPLVVDEPLEQHVVDRAHVAPGVQLEYLEHRRAERLDVEGVRLGGPCVQVLGHAVHVVVLPDRGHRRRPLAHPAHEVVPHLVEGVASLLQVLYLLYNHLLEHPGLPSNASWNNASRVSGCRLPSR